MRPLAKEDVRFKSHIWICTSLAKTQTLTSSPVPVLKIL